MKIKKDKIEELKKLGVNQIASIVKSHFASKYYHVVKIEDIEKNDYNWIPAPGPVRSGNRYTSGKKIDWTKTVKLSTIR